LFIDKRGPPMPNVRKISRNPQSGKNYYLVDANFLANRFIDQKFAPDSSQKDRIAKCNEWWKEIQHQLKQGKARVYVPDVCIAETFKVLAKKYYDEKWFKSVDLNNARNRLSKFVSVPPKTLKAQKRTIEVHDVSTTRDLIISVDRFYELFLKHKNNVSLMDLIIVATAKYLFDFFDIPKERLHIVTLDKALWKGSKKIQELPNAYDPTEKSDHAVRVFED
jgi:predicted nucleic acid-binding protein